MAGVTDRMRAVRDRITQRHTGGASEAEPAQSKAERAQKKAQAEQRRHEHMQKYSGGGSDGSAGPG